MKNKVLGILILLTFLGGIAFADVTVKNNGKVCLQLIGVTASKGARCWEPLWDAHYFKPLR